MIYTFETFAPAYPSRIKRATVVHRGRLEQNRDNLSPSMIMTREFEAKDDREAKKKARAASKIMGYRFLGLNDDN